MQELLQHSKVSVIHTLLLSVLYELTVICYENEAPLHHAFAPWLLWYFGVTLIHKVEPFLRNLAVQFLLNHCQHIFRLLILPSLAVLLHFTSSCC